MKSPRLLRVLALAGFLLSVYLLVLKLSGRIDYLVGCGGRSGCGDVLGSRWSQFFHLPVTAFAATLYALTLFTTWRPSRILSTVLAISFAGAALWFFFLLVFVIEAFCPWCTAAHLIGLTCAALLLYNLKYGEPGPGPSPVGILGGGLGILALVLGQLFGPVPDTYAVSRETVAREDPRVSVHARGEGRVVSVLNDNKFYNTGTLPHLGPSDAPHVLVEYFDYTCEACLEMHHGLELVAEKHPGQFCILMLPVPLNRACNEFFPPDAESNAHACELARLALTAWRASPESFPDVHEILFTRPVLPPEIAEIAVAQLTGEEALEKALADPWIDEVLAANNNDFRQLIGKTVKMPKLLVGKNHVLHGVTNTPEILLRTLEREFGLQTSD